MNKHTPAPWIATCATEYKTKVIAGDKVVTIARIGEGISTKEAEANARLIAAAPELLRQLKIFVGRIDTPQMESYFNSGDLKDAKAAIAKAEGKA